MIQSKPSRRVERQASRKRPPQNVRLGVFLSAEDADQLDREAESNQMSPEAPEIFFYQRRLTALIMGQVNVVEDLLFSQAAGQRVHRQVPAPAWTGRGRSLPPTRPHPFSQHSARLPTYARWSYAAGRTRTPTWSCCAASYAGR